MYFALHETFDLGIGDFFGEEFEESYVDARVEEAKEEILKLLERVPVVTDRELKVRLEKQFFPWVTGRALSLLLNSEVEKHGYAESRYKPRIVKKNL